MIYTYALPNLYMRRTQPAARIAYFAHILHENLQYPLVAGCVSCGLNTCNWCSDCEDEGRHFTAVSGQVLRGSPLCTTCDNDDNVECTVCAPMLGGVF